MTKLTKKLIIPALLASLLLLGSCSAASEGVVSADSDAAAAINVSYNSGPTSVLLSSDGIIDSTGLFSSRDLDASYDLSEAVSIELTGSGASCSSDLVKIDGGTITITGAGVYSVSGTLDDGQIIIDAGKDDKVQLILNGVSVTSETSAAIYSREADKLFITLADGTKNTLSNGGSYVAIDENNIDAAIFSKTDLTLNGSGALTINAEAGHGIVSKDELVVAGGIYVIDAAEHGMTGKDDIAIAYGSFTIVSGGDGIHADNDEDESLGYLYIADGSFDITSGGDAISASGTLEIDGGSFDLTTGGGSFSVQISSDASMGGRGQFGASVTAAASSGVSCKGVKSGAAMLINGGDFTMDTEDDAFHSGGDITIKDGSFDISCGDDAVHSDCAVIIDGGSFAVTRCYEGIEGQSVTVNGGSLDIVSYDDGFNAAGGSDSSGFGGGQDQFSADSSCFIEINGGEITIVSDGDSLDSNGSITINGGTLKLTCNGNGNTAIDSNGSYVNNGGSVTTNDGSESGGGMAGGNSGFGGKRGR